MAAPTAARGRGYLKIGRQASLRLAHGAQPPRKLPGVHEKCCLPDDLGENPGAVFVGVRDLRRHLPPFRPVIAGTSEGGKT